MSRRPAVEAVSSADPAASTSKPPNTTTISTIASTTHTVPRHMPRVTTGKTSSTISTYATASNWTLPRQKPIPRAVITTVIIPATDSADAIPSHMPKITAIITFTSAAAAIPPITKHVSTASSATIISVTSPLYRATSGGDDVYGLGLVALQNDRELDDLALAKSTKTVRFHGGLMDEQIFATLVGLNETIPSDR